MIETVVIDLPDQTPFEDLTIWGLVDEAGKLPTSLLHDTWLMLQSLENSEYSLKSLLDQSDASLTFFAINTGALPPAELQIILNGNPELTQLKLLQNTANDKLDLIDLFNNEQVVMLTDPPQSALVSVSIQDDGAVTNLIGGAKLLPTKSDIVVKNGVIHVVEDFISTFFPEPPSASESDYEKYGCNETPAWGQSYCCTPPSGVSGNEVTLFCICSSFPICFDDVSVICGNTGK